MSIKKNIPRLDWKRYTLLITGVLLISVVGLSVHAQPFIMMTTTQAIVEIPDLDPTMTDSIMDYLTDTDQVTKEAYDYLTSHWNPANVSFPLSTEDSSEDCFEATFIEKWFNDLPSYNHTEKIEDFSTVFHIEDSQQSITVKRFADEDCEIIEQTIISGKPRATLVEPDFSGIDNITIPIRSTDEIEISGSGSAAINQELRVVELIDKIGIGFELPSFNKYLTINLAVVRLNAWAVFEAGIHLYFPVKLIIEYPKEVIEGASHSLKCTLIPLDLPDYNEFEAKFIAEAGFDVDVRLPQFYWKKVKLFRIPFSRRWFYIYVPAVRWYWKTITGGSVDYSFYEYYNYQTPMAGEGIGVDLPLRIDLLPLIPLPIATLLSKVVSISLGLGTLSFIGEGITGELSVTAGTDKFSRTVGWMTSGETKSLMFTVPSADEQNLKISVSDLIFHAQPLVLTPELWFGFKDISLFGIKIPLSRWLGEIGITLPSISFGTLNIPSKFLYTTSGFSFTPAAVYDFDFDVEEISAYQGQGTLSNINSYDQVYRITLQNLGGRTDSVELGVSGLPEGYSAYFDRGLPVYDIGTVPTTATLIVSPPEYIKELPGEVNFTITATSKAKTELALPGASISKNASIMIPDIIDFDINLDPVLSDIVQVDHGNFIPIRFYGENLGNQNDTILLNATLYTNDENRTWENSYSLEPYANETGKYFDDEIGFLFSLSDIYPSPGLHRLEIEAASQRLPSLIKKLVVYLNFTENYAVETSITPQNITIRADWKTNFTMTVTNRGNTVDNFTLVSDGWNEYLAYPPNINQSGFTIYQLEPMQSEEITITLRIYDPEVALLGNHSFRIRAISEGSGAESVFNGSVVDIELLDLDDVPPRIEYVEPFYSSDIIVYPQSILTLGPSWKAFDEDPEKYEVFIDGEPFSYINGSWLENSPVLASVTGDYPFSEGIHNITITFNDTSGNIAVAQTWVTITAEDLVDPVINPVVDTVTIPENFANDYYITWNCTEEYLLNATIYKDGTRLPVTDVLIEPVENTSSSFRIKHALKPGTLGQGTWDYTLVIQDMGNNSESSLISVNVASEDILPPSFNVLPSTLANQSHGENITMELTDDHPDRFELFINGTSALNGTWQSGTQISIPVDDLPLVLGKNDLEIYVYDLADRYEYRQWEFTLRDIDLPELITEPSDFTIFEHDISQMDAPFWEVYDLNPATFTIYRDGMLLKSGSWLLANNTIQVPISDLSAGIYNFEVNFDDAAGNSKYSSVVVTVKDVLSPYIWPIEPIHFEPLYTADWFEFIITEAHPKNYRLYRNDTLVDEGPLSIDFPVVFVDMKDLESGSYTYRLEVVDESGNTGEQTAAILVTDYTPPFIRRSPDVVYSEGTTGHHLIWEIIESNPRNYSIFRDGALIQEGTLENMNLSISVDGLDLGIYQYTIIVYDEQGLSHSSISYVTVVDVTAPVITRIADCKFVAGDETAKLTWKVHDLHPKSFIIKKDGESIREESWDGSDIILQLVGWSGGIHVVEVLVKDTSDNVATDEVVVTITEEEQVTTITEKSFTPSPGFLLLSVLVTLAVISVITVFHRRRLHRES